MSHAAIIKLVRKYPNELKEFGPLGFEIRKGAPLPQGGFAKATEYAILNEPQATLLFTFMRNNRIVKAFKVRLIKEFYRMREALNWRLICWSPQESGDCRVAYG
ncbi:MAG: Rha family transcriptional regulator [Candidatus Thiodiazotropha lotti]|nr:Rha family transcriptional regulator [Candidatus Thiodiazotropha lotti]